jgi:outer membrane protein TolC
LQEKRGRIDRLVQSGYSSRLDLDRADTQISQIESNLAALDAQKSSLRNALAIFMQQTPRALDANLSRPNSLSLPTQVAPPNLDYIVRHRPDIRAAEWGLVSATHGERAAQLALYPDVSLNGSIFNFSSLTNIGSLTSSIVASITQPLFGRGRLLAGVDLETARVKQALLNYEEAVFQAALEIDTTLTTWDRRQKQLSFDEKTLNTAIEAQKRAQKLFFAGQESFTAVIVAENTRLAAEESYLLSRQAAFNSYINYAAATVPNW